MVAEEVSEVKVFFCDSTLRDGEQAPGVAFRREEKMAMARLLDEAGVDEIEVGVPAMGEREQQDVAEIFSMPLRAVPVAWNRTRREDIAASVRCGAVRVHVALPVSDIMIRKKLHSSRREVLSRLLDVVDYARECGMQVSVGFEDASRADPSFLGRVAESLEPFQVVRFRVADTVGTLTPWATQRLIARLKEFTAVPLEFHGHNDLGLAVANTLAALEAGAEWASTTVLGLGERAGNAALEAVAVGARLLLGREVGIRLSLLSRLAEQVSIASGLAIPDQAPVVGSRVFTHESGIHVDGVLKAPETYEPFPPEWVGRSRRIVFGRHSGRNGLRKVLEAGGFSPSSEELDALIERVRELAVSHKEFLTEEIICRLYREARPNPGGPPPEEIRSPSTVSGWPGGR